MDNLDKSAAAGVSWRRELDDEIATGRWAPAVVAELSLRLQRFMGPSPICDFDIALREDLAAQPCVEARFRWSLLPGGALTDPLLLLGRGGGEYRCLFRSRDMDETFVAMGALVTAGEPPGLHAAKGRPARWFGGMPFYREPVRPPVAEESCFSKALFFLPVMEWHCLRDEWQLCLRGFVGNEEGGALQPGEGSSIAALLCGVVARYFANDFPSGQLCPELLKSEDHPAFPHFVAMVERALTSIGAPQKADSSRMPLSKVVLARRKMLSLAAPDVDYRIFLRLLAAIDEESYLFAFEMPDGEVFLGRPPERLLRWRERMIEVDAIAGTIPRNPCRDCDERGAAALQNSPKDLKEHRWVADFVATRLSESCDGIHRERSESILKLKNVQHIVTRFRAQLGPDSAGSELLLRLHPTPAVGGVPTDEALKFLVATEPFDRRWFAGAVGVSDGSSGEFAIAIRTAFLKDGQLTLLAGAGIVEGSIPADEWREIELKFKNFLDLFAPLAAPQGDLLSHDGHAAANDSWDMAKGTKFTPDGKACDAAQASIRCQGYGDPFLP